MPAAMKKLQGNGHNVRDEGEIRRCAQLWINLSTDTTLVRHLYIPIIFPFQYLPYAIMQRKALCNTLCRVTKPSAHSAAVYFRWEARSTEPHPCPTNRLTDHQEDYYSDPGLASSLIHKSHFLAKRGFSSTKSVRKSARFAFRSLFVQKQSLLSL